MLPVLVVGGGPAGLAAAVRLREHGIGVVVVEPTGYDDIRIGEHIPPEGVRQISDLAARLGIGRASHLHSKGVEAFWGSDEPAYTDYLLQWPGLGLDLARPAYDSMLAQACEAAGATVLRRTRLIDVIRRGREWTARLTSAEGRSTLEASFLIDCSGRSAALARKLGARRLPDDNQIAIACVAPGSPDGGDARSLVEACAWGWWYCARLPDALSTCVLFTDADLVARNRRAGLPGWWLARFSETRHVSRRFDPGKAAPDLLIRSARSQRLDRCGGEGWLAAGDAASAWDPLSSRGILKALSQGRAVAEAIAAAHAGDADALERYCVALDKEYAAYLETRLGYYMLEGRWADAPYWRRRHVRAHPAAAKGMTLTPPGTAP